MTEIHKLELLLAWILSMCWMDHFEWNIGIILYHSLNKFRQQTDNIFPDFSKKIGFGISHKTISEATHHEAQPSWGTKRRRDEEQVIFNAYFLQF